MQESLEVAVQCLETAFELTPEDATSLSVSKSLLDIFHDAVASEVSFFKYSNLTQFIIQVSCLTSDTNLSS